MSGRLAHGAAGTSKNLSIGRQWQSLAEGQGSGESVSFWSQFLQLLFHKHIRIFSSSYSTNIPYYCGYYAPEVTNATAIRTRLIMWHLMPTAAQARIWVSLEQNADWSGKDYGNEKWVGFIGGGYDRQPASQPTSQSHACNTPVTYSMGKGFFVVDLRNGLYFGAIRMPKTAICNFSAPGAPYGSRSG